MFQVVLHSILAMLHVVTLDRSKSTASQLENKKRNTSAGQNNAALSLTEEIILFNEEDEESRAMGSNYSEATLISLVK